MTTRPTTSPLFATAGTFTSGDETGLSPRLDPGAGFRAQGWYPNRRLPARWFNFLRGLAGDWIDYLDQKNRHCYNVLNFGADPTGATDSTTAITAANAAASSSGGYVWLPPGSYRHDDSLHPSPGASWFGVPDATFVNINHATNPQLVFDNGSSRNFATEFFGIGFGALIDNTGPAVSVPNDVRVRFANCAWNDDASGESPLLKGKLLLAQGTNCSVGYDRCYVRAVGNADAMLLSSALGELVVERSRLIMPATFAHNLLDIDDGVLKARDNYFDVTAHTGSADIIQLLSTGWHLLKDNEFHGAFSGGACIRSFGGNKLSETGSVFDTVNAYNIASPLALGSELTLQNPIASTQFTSVFTCATGYRAQSFRVQSGAPSITLPAVLFMGQKFRLTVMNDTGSAWLGIGITGADGVAAGSVGAGQARTFDFEALDIKATGAPKWVLIGDPSSAFTPA